MPIFHSSPSINEQDIKAVMSVLKSGMIAKGQYVAEFEKALGTYIGVNQCKATCSGTSALYWTLKILGIGSGDEVILPTYVCHDVMEAILEVGALPMLCDIDNNWIMTTRTVSSYITKRTKAIIIVHIFGIPVDVEPFREFNVPIIEDCCQALGSENRGQKVGSHGDFCFFSFQATKSCTTGEGGAIASKSFAIPDRFSNYSRMSDLQAVLGLSQLRQYDKMLKKRAIIAKKYKEALGERNQVSPSNSSYYRFPIKHNGDFILLQNEFEKKGIHIRKGVDLLLHRKLKLADINYPNAVETYNYTISIPIYPALKENEIKIIIKAIKELL